MMFGQSRETDYSLVAMVHIASRPTGQLAYRRDIAANYSIPEEFLAKVLQKLARHGLIRSFRGVQGGYQLAREAREITLLDIVEVVEGSVAFVECQSEPKQCIREAKCGFRDVLMGVRRDIRRVLQDVSLSDLTFPMESHSQSELVSLRGPSR